MPNTTTRERDKHLILGGKVHLYRRGDSDNWHWSCPTGWCRKVSLMGWPPSIFW